MRRILTGLGATLILAMLLIGLPALLILIWPVGLPHVQPTPAGIWAALLRPDDGTLFLTLLKVAGWIVWAILLVVVGAELVAASRHLLPPRLAGLALPQGLVRGLVAASLALFINTNTALDAPPPLTAQAAPPAPAPAEPDQPRALHAEHATPGYEHYTVKKGDILSQIALDHLGDAHRYPEIYRASRSIHQPGGRRLTDPDIIDIGWKLNLPTQHSKIADPAHQEATQAGRHRPAGHHPARDDRDDHALVGERRPHPQLRPARHPPRERPPPERPARQHPRR